jgi:hypothetical protein
LLGAHGTQQQGVPCTPGRGFGESKSGQQVTRGVLNHHMIHSRINKSYPGVCASPLITVAPKGGWLSSMNGHIF